jgi:hypothetical protein
MQLQGRNLSIQRRGDNVKILHSHLRGLGYSVLSELVHIVDHVDNAIMLPTKLSWDERS